MVAKLVAVTVLVGGAGGATAAVIANGSSPTGSSATGSSATSLQPSPAAVTSSAAGSTSNDSGDCLLGANGADVEVGIANPTNSCGQWITNLAGSGLVWNYIGQMIAPGQPGTADQETMGQACDLTDGTQELYVEDAGGQSYGDSICSSEEQNGWTPESSPGPLAAQEQQQAQQEEQAQASASAAASSASASAAAQQAVQNKDNQDFSTAQGDIGTLQSDAGSLTGDVSSLNSDVTQANTDLATTKSDASQGQGSYCVNVDSTVYNDAASTLYNDQVSTTSNDANTLQTGIGSVRSDISTVNGDLQTLSADGIAAPSEANTAISSAQSAISAAVTKGNADISAVEADVSQGYAIANGLATGSCQGDGPGSPPSPVQPIS
jgi:hypothetical protein